MTKEVMKQALDSLEKERYYYCLYEDEDGAPEHILDAIQALKEALKQEQGEQGEQLARLGWQEIDCPICGGGARAFPKQEQGEIERLTVALKKANEQAEHFEREWYLRGDELEKLKQEQDEPVAWKTDDIELYVREDKFGFYDIPLYTHPLPKRKPLTDEQIVAIVREASHGSAIRREGSTSMRIARAIESAHGIKE